MKETKIEKLYRRLKEHYSPRIMIGIFCLDHNKYVSLTTYNERPPGDRNWPKVRNTEIVPYKSENFIKHIDCNTLDNGEEIRAVMKVLEFLGVEKPVADNLNSDKEIMN